MTTLASPAVGTSVRDASAAYLGADSQTAPLYLQGTQALVFYRFNTCEIQRRRRDGAQALNRLAALETLLQMPAGVPVAVSGLPSRTQDGIRTLPAGAASVTGPRGRREVTRHAVRPLAVDLAVVRASGAGWRSGLARASRFAPFCTRALLLDGVPARRDDLLMEADFYGVGVLLADTSGVIEMVLAPETYRPPGHTAGAWWFTEDLFQRLL